MKQIQWATASVGDGALRQAVEELLNQEEPWELQDWKVIGQTVDVNNQPIVMIAVCMVRDKLEPTLRGRPKKEDA